MDTIIPNIRPAAQTAFILAVLMLISRLIGFAREILMASYFGASYVVDAYVVSYNISTIILEGIIAAVATAFVPMFSKKVETEGYHEANLFTSRTNNILLLVTLFASVFSFIFSRQIVFLVASGWFSDPSMQSGIELAVFYVKVTFATMIFTSIAGVLESYLRYNNRFISALLSNFPINIGHIVFIFVAYFLDLRMLVGGLFIGNIIRLIIDYQVSKKVGYKHKWDFHFSDTVKLIIGMSLPVFIGSTSEQINAFINRILASWLPTGSIASLNYSFMIITFVTGVSSMVLFNMLYPKMAQAASLQNFDRWRHLCTSGVMLICIITAPVSLGGMLYNRLIIKAVFERNAFDSLATDSTSIALFYYSIGLVFIALIPFLARAFFSLQDTKTPVKIAVLCAAINIASNLILVRYLAHGGLALGMSFASFLNVLLLLFFINRKMGELINRQLLLKLARIAISSAISVFISYIIFVFLLNDNNGLSSAWGSIFSLLILILFTALVYIILLRIFKIEELKYFSQLLKKQDKHSNEV